MTGPANEGAMAHERVSGLRLMRRVLIALCVIVAFLAMLGTWQFFKLGEQDDADRRLAAAGRAEQNRRITDNERINTRQQLILLRLAELEKPPTNAQTTRNVLRALKACARDRKCRRAFRRVVLRSTEITRRDLRQLRPILRAAGAANRPATPPPARIVPPLRSPARPPVITPAPQPAPTPVPRPGPAPHGGADAYRDTGHAG